MISKIIRILWYKRREGGSLKMEYILEKAAL
jgi:hypothetical protein